MLDFLFLWLRNSIKCYIARATRIDSNNSTVAAKAAQNKHSQRCTRAHHWQFCATNLTDWDIFYLYIIVVSMCVCVNQNGRSGIGFPWICSLFLVGAILLVDPIENQTIRQMKSIRLNGIIVLVCCHSDDDDDNDVDRLATSSSVSIQRGVQCFRCCFRRLFCCCLFLFYEECSWFRTSGI